MIMQISKCGMLPNRKFRINDTELINTNIYEYLGILFDSSGNFSSARTNMNERGQKALFKLKSAVDRSFMSTSIAINLFDKTVKPVCLYGAEILGNFSISKHLSAADLIEKMYSKFPVEKRILPLWNGYWALIYRRTSNFAVLGDLGRTPLMMW